MADEGTPKRSRKARPRRVETRPAGLDATVKARDLPERAQVRRPRRKPRAKRTARELVRRGSGGRQTFTDPDLRRLHARGAVDELVGLVKGGKEATVYLVKRGDEHLAAKVYADIEARSFRNDAPYWEAVEFEDEGLARALRRKSRAGRKAQAALWVMREYSNLWRLHRAGVRVPLPALPPEPSAWAAAGSVVLMEFIGQDGEPAPRLADVRLGRDEAQAAYGAAAALAVKLAGLGLVHGDLSTYNLLWSDGQLVLIDVPQLMDARVGRAAMELLERDVASLASSFRALGAVVDERELAEAVREALPAEPPAEPLLGPPGG